MEAWITPNPRNCTAETIEKIETFEVCPRNGISWIMDLESNNCLHSLSVRIRGHWYYDNIIRTEASEIISDHESNALYLLGHQHLSAGQFY